MSESPASEMPVQPELGTSAAFELHEKILLLSGAAISFAAFSFGGRVFRIPTYGHFSASLLQQPNVVAAIAVTAIIYIAVVLVGSIIGGTVRFDVGLFSASIGLCALSLRGGAMRFTLQSATSNHVWTMLATEIFVLSVILAVGWLCQCLMQKFGLLSDDSRRDGVTTGHAAINQRLLSLATNMVVMIVTLMLLAASDRKGQAILAVGIAAYLGTITAYILVPTRPSPWFWVSPLLVGLLGYLWAYFADAPGWNIGEVRGTFAGLARPMPLDYAGAGVAAAILAYWTSRNWQHARDLEESDQESDSISSPA